MSKLTTEQATLIRRTVDAAKAAGLIQAPSEPVKNRGGRPRGWTGNRAKRICRYCGRRLFKHVRTRTHQCRARLLILSVKEAA